MENKVIKLIDNMIEMLQHKKEAILKDAEQNYFPETEFSVLNSIIRNYVQPYAKVSIEDLSLDSIAESYDEIVENINTQKINSLCDVVDIASENFSQQIFSLDGIDLEIVYGYGLEDTFDLWKENFGSMEDFKTEWAYQEIIREKMFEQLKPYLQDDYKNKDEFIADLNNFMKAHNLDYTDQQTQLEQEVQKPKAMKM
ncbi:hypothetical protein [Ureaplasma diversum]|uniref:Uncharacterized protein n=1 Tax=Ureaplasma diversum NCTC 246 TaxID=1188241 RepID=A0A084EZ23_9BACT|nr:hypothetical protein [Ureaplasma diversum]KEZ23215.1 hypothetical protein UDIV_3790 [Ureaplasma diversum NCTC 246]